MPRKRTAKKEQEETPNYIRYVQDLPDERECPDCDGTGYDPYDGGQCVRCAGTGTISRVRDYD